MRAPIRRIVVPSRSRSRALGAGMLALLLLLALGGLVSSGAVVARAASAAAPARDTPPVGPQATGPVYYKCKMNPPDYVAATLPPNGVPWFEPSGQTCEAFGGGPLGIGSATDSLCDGVSPIGNDCLPGLHFFLWSLDEVLAYEVCAVLPTASRILVATPNLTNLADTSGSMVGGGKGADAPLGCDPVIAGAPPAGTGGVIPDPVVNDMTKIQGAISGIAMDLLFAFAVLAIIRAVLVNIGSGDLFSVGSGVYRAIMGLIFLNILPTLLNLWFGGLDLVSAKLIVAVQASFFPTSGTSSWLANNLNLPYYTDRGYTWPYYSQGAPWLAAQDTAFCAVFLVLLVLLLVIIGYSILLRLTGLFTLVALFIVAPLCVVTWISHEFGGIARWWFSSFVSYSLWGIAYGIVLATLGVVLKSQDLFVGTSGLAPGSLGAELVLLLVALGGLLTLSRVPEIMDGVLGGIGSAAGGVAGMRAGVGAVAKVFSGR